MNTAHFCYRGRGASVSQLIPSPLSQIPLLALIFFIAFVGITLPSVSWAVITVSITTDEDKDSASGGLGCSLREAIKAASTTADYNGCTYDSDKTISLGAKTYQLTTGPSISIDSAMTIEGTDKDTTIIERTTNHQVFIINSTTDTTIKNVTMKGGTSGTGGNIYVKSSAKLILENTIVSHGTSGTTGPGNGGGILNSGTASLKNATLIKNYSANKGSGGGAIFNGSGATLILDNVSITNNSSSSKGGGIFHTGASLEIKGNTIIENNTSQLCGAGVLVQNSNVTITNSTLQNNLYKGSSPSDLVSKGNLTIYDADGEGDKDENINDSYVGAYIDNCYKSVFLLIDDFVEDTTDSVDITKGDLEDALGTGSSATVEEENMDGYKERIKNELDNDLSASVVKEDNTTVTGSSNTEFEDAQTKLESLINSVNNGTSKIADFIDNDTTNPLTDEQLLAELKKAGLKNIVDANVDKYRAALTNVSLAKADGDTVAELQGIIDDTNLQKIKDFAGGTGDLDIAQLQVSNLTNVDPALIEQYKTAISGATIGAYPDGWEDLQAIIDQVNAANSTTTTTNSDDTSSSGGFGTPPPQPDYYQLNVASPNGRVTSSQKDVSGNAIDCNKGSGYCRGLFKRGATVNLTATAPTGLLFDSWDGSSDCLDGKVIMNSSRNCKALFYGDPDYVAPEEDNTDDNTDSGTGDNGTGNTGTDGTTGTSNSVYVDSFSIRAKIQGKNACYQNANPHPNDVVVAGFILEGNGTEKLLIRALDLEQDVNPKIIVKQTVLGNDGLLRGINVAKNDAWVANSRAQEIPESLIPDKQTDAALLLDLTAGAYTVIMCMSPNSKVESGIALVSVTLLDNTLRFNNVSGRGYVSGGANDAITGFTIYGGDGYKTARIKGRALGETPETYIDSTIEIGNIYFDPQINQVIGNRLKNVSSWRDETSINDLPLDAELGDTDAAASMSFGSGSYTTILSSENGVPGLGIVYIEFLN